MLRFFKKTVFHEIGTFRFFQKPFFTKPELSDSSKNRFSQNRNFPIPPKTVFHESGTPRFIKKPFSGQAERSAAPTVQYYV
jgi:hypothetical protein